MLIVELPDGSEVEFPEGTHPDEMSRAISKMNLKTPQTQEPDQEGFQQANRRRVAQFLQGIPQGLGNVATGFVQAATDLGESGARSIEKAIYGDVLNQDSFGKRLSKNVSALKSSQSQLPTSEKVGIFLGEVAPFVPIGTATGAKVAALTGSRLAGLSTSSAIGSGVSEGLSIQDEYGLKNRAQESLKSAAVGGISAPLISKAAPLISKTPSAAKSLLRNILGVDPDKAKKFAEAGLDPTLANVSKFRPVSQLQNFLSATPGASARIDRVVQHQIDNVAAKVQEIAGSKGGTMEEAGKTIGEGASSFLERRKKMASDLYEGVFKKVPKTSKVNLSNFDNLLADPEIQQAYISGGDIVRRKLDMIYAIKSVSGISNVNTPFEVTEIKPTIQSIKSIRSNIGKTLESPMDGADRAVLKKVYGALSADLKDSLQKAAIDKYGEEGALRVIGQYNAADAAFKLNSDFYEQTIKPLEDAKTPDRIYEIATSRIKKGGFQISNILSTLNPEQKAFVRGSIVNRMGKAPQSLQNETNTVFSLSKFRQDYNALDDSAKKAIFTPEQLDSYDKLLKATTEIERTGRLGKSMANSQFLGWAGITGAVWTPYLTLPQAAGIVGGARITAGMMTYPKFVKWLSEQPKIQTTKGIKDSIAKLGAIAISSDPNTRDDILEYMSFIKDASASNKNNLSEEQIIQEFEKQKKQFPGITANFNFDPETIKHRQYRNDNSNQSNR